MFAEEVRKHGVTVNTKNSSRDFITMKFDYGVDAEEHIDATGNKIFKPSMSTQELRDYYYENGATVYWKTYDTDGKEINGKTKPITYKMLMRSPGKAKEGHCIFIREDLHKKTLDYITMGLYDKMPFDNAKIVELSAYSTLITATAIDYITIPMENIFVLKDEKVSTMKRAVVVKTRNVPYIRHERDYKAFEDYINKFNLTFYKKKAKENPELTQINKTKKDLEEHKISVDDCPLKEIQYYKKECIVDRGSDMSEISNILWDGMGLIDESIFPVEMEGFIYCRSHFFKSCLFRGYLQEYFKDYYGDEYESAYETDMLGRKMKVSDIKVIITENSLKWMKFKELMGKTDNARFRYYDRFMKKHGEKFAIVKTAHSSKWGDLQRSSYQINNTLLTIDKEILLSIAKISIDYLDKLKIDDEAFLKHLEITGSARYSINNVLIALYRLNDNFKYTKYFKNKRADIISRLKKERLQLGKLLQHGDNLTICGNPVAMLMKVTGQDFLNENCFEQIEDGIQCYTTRFPDGEKIAGFRSPHNSMNNIVHLENVYPAPIKKYFPNLGNNVIIINGIGTDVQSRLNGQDLDTDAIYATNQKEIVKLAREAYLNYPTIINDIKTIGTSEYNKNMKSYSKMDSDISAAQYAIGASSNMAQLALSYYFHSGRNSRELEDVFVICSVLAQVAIDSAKRDFEIKVTPELSRISQLSCMKQNPRYPRFYAEVQKENDRKKKKRKKLEIKDSDIGNFQCPMDILYDIIDKEPIDLRKNKSLNRETISFKEVFEYRANKVKVDRKQYRKVIGIVMNYDENVNKLDKDAENYHEDKLNEFEVCVSKLKNLTIKDNTMYTLITYAFKDENAQIRDKLLTVLYDKSREDFLKCFKKTEKSPQKIAKSLDL